MNKHNSKIISAFRRFSFVSMTLAFFLLSSLALQAQEVLLGLGSNPVLIKKYHEIKKQNTRTKAIRPDTIDITTKPFLDDFAKESIYPDTALWLDSNVFINRDYPIQPPTMGVATFDGLSKSGLPYDTTLLSSSASLPADTLTSKPINLAFPASDSIYLSFFWQAMGRGNAPEHSDSLILQFRNPSIANDSFAWGNVWYKNGYLPSASDTAFHLVMIPITNPVFLQKGFQFRFRNYATISGDVDHWHIDYVYLARNRSLKDTIFDDVAFTYNSRPLLQNYYAMPWEQYRPAEMKTNLSFFIRNNDSITKNISITDTIFETPFTYGWYSNNILPYTPNGYMNDAIFSSPSLSGYSFPTLTQDTSFLMECVLKTNDKNLWNDTLRFKQNFYNYYAYDDGTAEASYGLNSCSVPGQLAYKFTLNQPDSLFAVQMLFTWVPQLFGGNPSVNQQQFKIRVWNDNGGIPGSVIYEDTIATPNYEYVYHPDWGNLTNSFYPYILKTPQHLSGTFYVGLIQYVYPCSTLVNLGFDRNTNSNSKMFYEVGNGWTQSVLQGSWMIRPVFGTMKGLLSAPALTSANSTASIFPNPTSGKFRVEEASSGNTSGHNNEPGEEKYSIAVFDLAGRKVFSQSASSLSEEFDLSSLTAGMYFIHIQKKGEPDMLLNQKIILDK
ncbi:MAG TPA: T9SS type A sorting domain-containing protein [Bacteroidia bacterium]